MNTVIVLFCKMTSLRSAPNELADLSASLSALPARGGVTVDLSQCHSKSTHLTLTDDSFAVTSRGEIVAARPVFVSAPGRTFSVSAEDSAGRSSKMEVHLDCATQVIDR